MTPAGIGAKSHSSSMEEAQADRVRRKAEREGLIREVQPEQPKPAKAKAKAKKAAPEAVEKPAAEAPKEPEVPSSPPAKTVVKRPRHRAAARKPSQPRRGEACGRQACGDLLWQRAPATSPVP